MPTMPTSTHECSRCQRLHNGGSPPPGWGHYPGHGLLCDDCGQSLNLPDPKQVEKHRAAA